jgi:hypothetical protein
VRRRAGAGVTVAELAGLRAGERHQLGQGLGGNLIVRHQDAGRRNRNRNRHQVALRVVGWFGIQAGIDRDRGTRHHQRMAVRFGLDRAVNGQIAAGAGDVLDHDGLAPGFGKPVGEITRREVGRAPRRKADQNAHRAIRIAGLRTGFPDRQREQRRHQGKFHLNSHARKLAERDRK